MTDRLGEALAWWENGRKPLPAATTAEEIEHLAEIIVAARSWHALTNPTDELIERFAKSVVKALERDVDMWPTAQEHIREAWRDVARQLVDALSDTAEPEDTGPNTSDH